MTRDIHFQSELQGALSNEYAVKVGDFQWVQIPSGQSVAWPEATAACHTRADH